MQRFRALQGHASVESLASVSTHGSIGTLESISSRIAECSAHSVEDDEELIDDSNDPIQWLQEQALRADLHPPPISADMLTGCEGEDAISDDDLSVCVGLSKNSTLLKSWCTGRLINRYRQKFGGKSSVTYPSSG